MSNKRFHWETRPIALVENIVSGKNYRFTVLTSRLIRMEYSPNGIFEDRPSQSFFYRDFPKVSFEISRTNGKLKIRTTELCLTYKEEEEFSEDNLSISLKSEPASTWRFGEDFDDLGGTCQTLDTVDGAIPLERGVCSRFGFSVLDDSDTLLLGEDDWVHVRVPNSKDVYFFGYGYNYLDAIKDLYKLTGEPPMLPDYALGNWWSRYYKYTQQEYLDLMERFRDEDVPFSVSVVDMDWHLVDIPKEFHDENDPLEGKGWTGYTWNRELFPDYKEFLKCLKTYNLKTALNLHPHAGVRRFDDMYEEMAKACGVDPKCGKRIPFNILSPDFMKNYFDILHHPYEEAGVNFWWMDWQQGKDYSWIHEPNKDGKMQDEREVLNPLWMLNHLHILDISRNGKRPMFFSRYCGPGSHRYPIGFSGDTVVSWASLKFQPYFTATASNIGYGWWSHDIGGHDRGYCDEELVVRWIQLGVFSPINRLHSSNDPFVRKEPWMFGGQCEEIIKKWLRLRHRLFPYVYTMNYRMHKELVPFIQPMYYTYPKSNAAYEVPGQFWFGSELLVAPITEKNSVVSKLGKAEAWLPAGDWFDFFDGTHYASSRGRKLQLHRELEGYPVLAKAGAIVPMAEHVPHNNKLGKAENMEVVVFPGKNNHFVLYEDAGDMHDYQKGEYVTTEFEMQWSKLPCFSIHAAKGELTLIPQKRNWTIHLRGFHRNIAVKVYVDGKLYSDGPAEKVVRVTADVTSEIQVFVHGMELINDNVHVKEKCLSILQGTQVEFATKNQTWELINDDSLCLHKKLYKMASTARQNTPMVEAIREQLSLTEDEYLGTQR